MPALILKSITGEFGVSLMDLDEEDGFFVNIEIEIGEKDKHGADVFSFNVCNEKGLLKAIWTDSEFKEKQITNLSGYNVFVMKNYSLEALVKYIEDILNAIPENLSRKQKGLMLSQYFYWEYFKETVSNI